MRLGERSDRTGRLAGIAAGAILMGALMIGVSLLVVRYCPGGEHCQETARKLYGLGLLVSLALSAAFGLVVRDIVDRRRRTG